MKTSNIFGTSVQRSIVVQMPLIELNWRVFIVSPPADEQGAY